MLTVVGAVILCPGPPEEKAPITKQLEEQPPDHPQSSAPWWSDSAEDSLPLPGAAYIPSPADFGNV